jgi:hypothetical protein
VVRRGMARARRNPEGFRPGSGDPAQIVRVGERGVHTHLYDPHWEARQEPKAPHACKSGVGAGRRRGDGTPQSRGAPQVYASNAKTITCYRCIKLAEFNLARFKTAVPQAP